MKATIPNLSFVSALAFGATLVVKCTEAVNLSGVSVYTLLCGLFISALVAFATDDYAHTPSFRAPRENRPSDGPPSTDAKSGPADGCDWTYATSAR